MSVMSSTRRAIRFERSWEYRFLLALTFPLFFGSALLARIAHGGGAGTDTSLFDDARARAGAVLPLAFGG